MNNFILGTAQFGMPYGVCGRGEQVPIAEIADILKFAWEQGITTLDTAHNYGVIEAQLVELMGDFPFAVISKIPLVPKGLKKYHLQKHIDETITKIHKHLGRHLVTILFHYAEDLLDDRSDTIWRVASDVVASLSINLGVSCYSPEDLALIYSRYPVQIAQLPGNVFDQRVRDLSPSLIPVEIHMRSIFLQGLLLEENPTIMSRLPIDPLYLMHWHAWCKKRNFTVLEGAISVAKGLPNVRKYVVGVQYLQQLKEISLIWGGTIGLDAFELAVNNPKIVDPRYWVNDKKLS